MTIEQKALELVNAVAENGSVGSIGLHHWTTIYKALCRALEAHEADKARHAAEMREQAERFSEACETWLAKWKHGTPSRDDFKSHFWPYLPAPVDPLVEALEIALWNVSNVKLTAGELAEIAAIVKKEAVND